MKRDAPTKQAVVVRGQYNDYMYANDPAFTTTPVLVPQRDFDLSWLAQDEYYAVMMR